MRKAAIKFVMFVRLSARNKLDSHRTICHKFDIWDFVEYLSRKPKIPRFIKIWQDWRPIYIYYDISLCSFAEREMFQTKL